MRHHKGLGVGHIYTHLKPDNSILLSDDATTTHPTHRLDDDDDDYPSIVTRPPPGDDENPQIDTGVVEANIDTSNPFLYSSCICTS